MVSRSHPQDLSGGDASTNLQAGRDIVYAGASFTEIRTIALDVYRQNALELRGIAEDTALARAEKLTNEFLGRFMQENPGLTGNLADPDVQSVLFEAQRDYARSGEDDLAQVLVDLLSDRAVETERTLRTLALNEAIASAPKLTEQQRRALALVFFLRYARSATPSTLDVYLSAFLAPSVLALGTDLPPTNAHYQHIEYVGAGAVSISELSFAAGVKSGVEGFFTTGFSREQIPEELRDSPKFDELFMPCRRNETLFQVRSVAAEDIPKFALQLDAVRWEQTLKELSSQGQMSDEDINAELVAFDGRFAPIIETWTSTSLRALTLTSVGLAIGHAYWQRASKNSAPLSIWL